MSGFFDECLEAFDIMKKEGLKIKVEDDVDTGGSGNVPGSNGTYTISEETLKETKKETKSSSSK